MIVLPGKEIAGFTYRFSIEGVCRCMSANAYRAGTGSSSTFSVPSAAAGAAVLQLMQSVR